MLIKTEQRICDRCRQPLKYRGWTAKLPNVFRRGKIIKVHEIFNGNPDGYSYLDHCVELCADCTKAFKTFMNQKGAEAALTQVKNTLKEGRTNDG